MTLNLETAFQLGGVAQASILIASALVPFRLDWKKQLGGLGRLQRQMYWTYGGYIVMTIVAMATVSLLCPQDLAQPTRLSRAITGFIALFWGVRVGLQAVFEVKEHLTTWWLRAGYHLLSVLFLGLAAFYGWATLR